MNYPEQTNKGLGGLVDCGSIRRQTLRERLEEQKRMAEDALANINQALAFMDKNPGYEEFHNIIGKTGF